MQSNSELHHSLQRKGTVRNDDSLITASCATGYFFRMLVWCVAKSANKKSREKLQGIGEKQGGDAKMAKRRVNGEGSIRKRTDGRWEGR